MINFLNRPCSPTLLKVLLGVIGAELLLVVFNPFIGARHRPNARRASCQSNLKQIGLAMMQYSQDYDDRLPQRVAQSNGHIVRELTWKVALLPYAKSKQLFACPTNEGKDHTDAANFPISYTTNGGTPSEMARDFGGGTSPLPFGGRSLKSITAPAQTIAITECGPAWLGTTLDVSYPNSLFAGHLNTANFLFADGHVKALKPSKTGTPLNMWNVEAHKGDDSLTLKLHLRQWEALMEREGSS